MIFYDEDRLVTCGHDGRLVLFSRAAAATEGVTKDRDGGGLVTWNFDTNGERDARNSCSSKTEEGTYCGIIRCVECCPLTLGFGTIDGEDDGVSVPSVLASGSGDDGLFRFF